MKKNKWVWMPHAGHFIGGHKCRFHLSTYVGKYIVSTVGEYWPSRSSREIHAKITDPDWYAANKHLLGDLFDWAYLRKFGYYEIGIDRTYETMVFLAKKANKEQCCPWVQKDGREIDFMPYNSANLARKGHLKLCEKWSRK